MTGLLFFIVKERVALACLSSIFGGMGGGDQKKPLKAAFTVWMDCRCIDRVVIMVREDGGWRGVVDGVCMLGALWGRRTGCAACDTVKGLLA